MIELVLLCSNIDICTRLFRRRTSVCIRAWPTGPPTSSSRASTCSRSRRSRIPFKSVSHHLALDLVSVPLSDLVVARAACHKLILI